MRAPFDSSSIPSLSYSPTQLCFSLNLYVYPIPPFTYSPQIWFLSKHCLERRHPLYGFWLLFNSRATQHDEQLLPREILGDHWHVIMLEFAHLWCGYIVWQLWHAVVYHGCSTFVPSLLSSDTRQTPFPDTLLLDPS